MKNQDAIIVKEAIVASNKLVVPSGLNLQNSNTRTITPCKGAIGYEYNTQTLYYGNDSEWLPLANGGATMNAWLLLGNAGTVSGINYLGTQDAQPVLIATNVGGGPATKGTRFDLGGQIETIGTGQSVFVGEGAGINTVINTGIRNTLVGYHAGNNVTIQTDNTALGWNALSLNTDSQETAIGSGALQNYVNGSSGGSTGGNTALGYNALNLNSGGNGNTAIGWSVLANDVTTTQGNNTGVGWSVLITNTTGNNNTGLGNSALYSNDTGFNNVGIGPFAGYSITSGDDNVCIGYETLVNENTGMYNIAIGSEALYNVTGSVGQVAIGYQSLVTNSTGTGNTACGHQTLLSNDVGSANSAFGYQALYTNAFAGEGNGDQNTAIGYQSMYFSFGNDFNTAVGYQTLYNLSTFGSNNYNVSLGYLAGTSIVSGSTNIFIGAQAGQMSTFADGNIMIGYQSGIVCNGSGNLIVGSQAANNLTDGTSNIIIYGGANYFSNESSNILIGSPGVTGDQTILRIGGNPGQFLNAAYIDGIYNHSVGTGSSNVVFIDTLGTLGTLPSGDAYISGVRGVTPVNLPIQVYIGTDGQLGTVSSLRRLKDNISSVDEDNNRAIIKSLIPRTFTMKKHKGKYPPQYGFIVEEVHESLIAHDINGEPETIFYQYIPILLTKETQRLGNITDEHTLFINENKIAIANQTKLISKLTQTIADQRKIIDGLIAKIKL